MEDIITIESAISETEYEIERLSGTMRHYDALVDYATVTLELSEVYRLSGTEDAPKSFGDKADNLPSAQLPFHAPSSLSAPVKPGKHYSLREKEGLYTAKAALNGRLLHFFSYSANRGTMTPAGAFFVSSKEFPSSLWIFFASYSARNSSSVPISG